MPKSKRRSAAAPQRDPPGPSPRRDALRVGVCVLAAAILIVTTWAAPRPGEDLYTAYAGGRDVVDGKLGAPDDWCFHTAGRVWVNQNWGGHLLVYLTWQGGGEVGILALKMALLVVTAAFVAVAARQRGAGRDAAALVAGCALIVSRAYIGLRPDMFTLALAPILLWMLGRTRDNPRRILWAVALMAIWANVHGGFVFGLGMIFLWVCCRCIPEMVRSGSGPALRRLWPLPAGLLAAVGVCGLLTPFGLKNLTHFLEVSDPVWRQVEEWKPVWRPARYGSTMEFFIFAGVLAGLAVLRVLAVREKRVAAPDQRSRPGAVVFDVLLGAGVLWMAGTSRRFIPLATVVTAPMLAGMLTGLLERIGRRRLILVPAAAVVLVVVWPWRFPATSLMREYEAHYAPGNPFYPPEVDSIYKKMIRDDKACPNAAEFLNRNRIGGRTVQEWRWEGYLHWRCPQLKLYVGSRAQQIHTTADFWRQAEIWGGAESLRKLGDLGVDLVIGPVESLSPLLAALRADRRWAPIYYDGSAIVLAYAEKDPGRRWVREASAGQLWYPSERVRAWSRALCLARAAPDATRAFPALREANRRMPNQLLYRQLHALVNRMGLPAGDAVAYLESEQRRLAGLDAAGNDAVIVLAARIRIAEMLEAAYRSAGHRGKAGRQQETLQRLARAREALNEEWR